MEDHPYNTWNTWNMCLYPVFLSVNKGKISPTQNGNHGKKKYRKIYEFMWMGEQLVMNHQISTGRMVTGQGYSGMIYLI